MKSLVALVVAGTFWTFAAAPSLAQIGANLPGGDSPAAATRELLPPGMAGPAHWTAHWIIAPDAGTGANLMFLARRAFDLPDAPTQATIHITADTRYQLFVNGTFVQRGPARSAAHHQSYDTFDIAGFLRPGKNVLAVRVHHSGLDQPYHEATRPGLLVQVEFSPGDVRRNLNSDPEWRTVRDLSWDSDSPRIGIFHDGFVDIVDLRKRLDDWTSPAFDDASWPRAESITPRGVAGTAANRPIPGLRLWWPPPPRDQIPQAITPPWVTLVPRDLPPLRESTVRATKLVFAGTAEDPAAARPHPDAAAYRFTALPLFKLPPINESQTGRAGVAGVAAYERQQAPLVVDGGGKGRSTFLVFDLGEAHNGHSRLDIEGPAGAIVDVLCTPYLLNRVLNPTIVNSFNADRLVLSGSRQQWEAFFFKPTRYLALIVRGASEPVRLYSAGLTRIEYPWTRSGRFETPENPWLARFWQAGARTIEVITTDAYTDNYRERRQYAQTSYYAAQGNYATFGDTFLQRRYLLQIAQEQEPNGFLSMFAPMQNGRFLPFLDAQFFWIMGWRDYLLHSGDAATARRLLPAAQRAMQRLAELAQPGGLIVDPPYPYWIDHSHLDRRGANFCVNALYVLALDDYAQTVDWLGEPGGEQSRRAAAAVRELLRTKFWDPQRNLFTEALVAGKHSPRFSEHANSIAVAAHIATPEQTRAILPKVLRPDADLVPATSLFVYWTLAALCQNGRIDDAMAMMEARFTHQMQTGNGTLWENWHLDRTNSQGSWEKKTWADAQGECGIFPMALARWVAGVEAVAPGMREITVRRTESTLKNIHAVLPSPLGNLSVRWSAVNGGGELATEVPRGMHAKLDLSSLAVPGAREVLIDDTPLGAAESGGRWYRLPEGSHRLTYRSR